MAGAPFHATEAPWVHRAPWPEEGGIHAFPTYITDGPWLHRTGTDELLMLWSSSSGAGYAMGVARSTSGGVLGPWIRHPEPLWNQNGGHGMLFRRFDGQLMLTFHSPNHTPHERPMFVGVEDTDGYFRLAT